MRRRPADWTAYCTRCGWTSSGSREQMLTAALGHGRPGHMIRTWTAGSMASIDQWPPDEDTHLQTAPGTWFEVEGGRMPASLGGWLYVLAYVAAISFLVLYAIHGWRL